ncbi:hypothetical protein BDV93DRAFT_562807 [Ceratobasidium sp. AG-I]|nr:hypothetical protein BDV93DRAFT_562807 [Ceratobasidium sp. AG-I]
MAHTPLDALPAEVVEEIAFHACASPFLGPPVALPVLLRTSRRLHAVLAVANNPGFHARIFRAKFDTAAPQRRFLAAGQPLSAANYALELPRRWTALRRIRHIAAVGRLFACGEEDQRADFWLLYLMFLESDGKNYEQLIEWANVTSYVRTYIREQLMPNPRPGFPLESTERSLGLWLTWFLTEVHVVVAEMSPDTAQMHNMLRPWVFGSFKYDTLYAPYTHYHLPAPLDYDANEPHDAEELLTPQHLANLHLRDRTEIVTHMSRRIRLSPPPAASAAIMAFMVRLERNGPIPAHNPPVPPAPAPEVGFPSTIPLPHPGLTVYPRTRFPSWYGPGSIEFDGRVNTRGSAQWDTEWSRIATCGNPFAPVARLQPKFYPGDLAGDWEGRFVFLTFDAFRDMLAGSVDAVRTGSSAQQPQVWRIQEHHCIQRRRRVQTSQSHGDEIINESLPLGQPLNACIPANAEFMQHVSDGTEPDKLEVRIPDSDAPGGFKSYTYMTLGGIQESFDTRGGMAVRLPENHRERIPIPYNRRDVHPGPYEEPERYQGGGDDEWIETITDTLITGEGHSSWGKFRLRGRIRPWDGMITLVKDYAGPQTEGRGRWLYKGYIIAGGNWVGRWRDTFTATRLSGYEGVFSVSRRQ